jgi:hypothetical protein
LGLFLVDRIFEVVCSHDVCEEGPPELRRRSSALAQCSALACSRFEMGDILHHSRSRDRLCEARGRTSSARYSTQVHRRTARGLCPHRHGGAELAAAVAKRADYQCSWSTPTLLAASITRLAVPSAAAQGASHGMRASLHTCPHPHQPCPCGSRWPLRPRCRI